MILKTMCMLTGVVYNIDFSIDKNRIIYSAYGESIVGIENLDVYDSHIEFLKYFGKMTGTIYSAMTKDGNNG